MKIFAMIMAASTLLGVAFAQETADDTLAIYAGLAKLEANVDELAASLAMFALNEGEGEFAENYDEDEGAVYGYLRALERLNITDEMRTELEDFRAAFKAVEDAGEEILEASDVTPEALREDVNALYTQFEDLDDKVDGMLEALLTENSVVLDTAKDEE